MARHQSDPPRREGPRRPGARGILAGIAWRPSRRRTTSPNMAGLYAFHSLYTEVPDINNLGNLLSHKRQLLALQSAGVLAQF